MTNWQARADALSAKDGEARVPNNWFREVSAAPYVRMKTDGKTVVLKVVASGTNDDTELIVTVGTLSLDDGKTVAVTAEPLSSGGYYRHWLRRTCPGRLTVVGLLIILIGQGIQVSLDIGAHWVIFDVGSAGIALLNAAKDVMTVGGAALAAWQVVLNS